MLLSRAFAGRDTLAPMFIPSLPEGAFSNLWPTLVEISGPPTLSAITAVLAHRVVRQVVWRACTWPGTIFAMVGQSRGERERGGANWMAFIGTAERSATFSQGEGPCCPGATNVEVCGRS